jgi:type I restriction enzyme R subunit
VAKAYYGLCYEKLTDKIANSVVAREIAKNAALYIDRLIKNAIFENDKIIIDWQSKTNITGKLLIEVGDYFIDEVRDKYDIELSFSELDQIAGECIEVAKIRYR